MDMHHLKVFLSVFRNRSFSKASRELYLTQPTVSDHIKSLEEELECTLFDRSGRKIVPTGEAGILYNHAVELLDKADHIRHALGQFKKEVSGELVIGASSIPGTYLLPALMATFRKKYPSISYQVLVSDSRAVVEKVVKHELLAGLVGSKLNVSQIAYIPFMEDELVVVAAPSLVKKRRIRLLELSDYPMVMREEGSGTRRETEKILGALGYSMETAQQAGVFGSTDAIKQAVKAGLGVAVVSRLSVADELGRRTLKEIKLIDVRMKRNFYIATHRKRLLPRHYQLFLEHVQSASRR